MTDYSRRLQQRADSSDSSSASGSTSQELAVVSQIEGSSSGGSSGGSSSKENSKSSPDDSKSDKSSDSSGKDSKSASTTASSDKSSSKKSTSTSTFSTSINPNLPAGGIQMMTPTSTSTTYVKVGDVATFKWKYTSLSVTPSALNVELAVSADSQTQFYTLTTNMSADTTEFFWDTGDFPSNHTAELVNSMYTLYIFDSSSNVSAVASAGYLSVFDYPFGVYIPQSYTPWAQDSSYINVGSIVESPVTKIIIGMFVVMFTSAFTVMFSAA